VREEREEKREGGRVEGRGEGREGGRERGGGREGGRGGRNSSYSDSAYPYSDSAYPYSDSPHIPTVTAHPRSHQVDSNSTVCPHLNVLSLGTTPCSCMDCMSCLAPSTLCSWPSTTLYTAASRSTEPSAAKACPRKSATWHAASFAFVVPINHYTTPFTKQHCTAVLLSGTVQQYFTTLPG